jgi:hypothetical protein
MDEHIYYWAWQEADNKGISYFRSNYERKFRVFRVCEGVNSKDEAITEPMHYQEAKTYAHRIAKLTEGRILQ